MELLLVRHAEPVREVVAEGMSDPDLHERGVRQAEWLAAYLAEEAIDAVYSSPMRRARSTAARIADRLGCDVHLDEGLVEFDRGAAEYIPVEELRASDDERYHQIIAGDSSGWGFDIDAFRAGAVAAIERIVDAHPGGRVVVVCHGGVINAYLGRILGVEKFLFFHPDYTSIHRVRAARSGERTLVCLNERAHLRGRVALPG